MVTELATPTTQKFFFNKINLAHAAPTESALCRFLRQLAAQLHF